MSGLFISSFLMAGVYPGRVETADEIGENMELQVWGERSGGRVIAAIVVYGPLGGGAFD